MNSVTSIDSTKSYIPTNSLNPIHSIGSTDSTDSIDVT